MLADHEPTFQQFVDLLIPRKPSRKQNSALAEMRTTVRLLSLVLSIEFDRCVQIYREKLITPSSLAFITAVQSPHARHFF